MWRRTAGRRGVRIVKLAYVGLPVGSTSAFMAVLGHAFGVLDGLGPAGKAAAALGIYTDTSALLHGATPLDFKMFEVLTQDEATQDILDELRDYRVPPEWYVYKGAAFQNMEVTGAVRVAPIGFVREEHRDVIAEIANELLRIEGTSIGVVGGGDRAGDRGVAAGRQSAARRPARRASSASSIGCSRRPVQASPASSTSVGRRTGWRGARAFP